MNTCFTPKQRHTMITTKFRPVGVPHPMNALLNDFLGRDISQLLGHDDTLRFTPAVNIVEQAEAFVIHLNAPGFHKEELKINIDGDLISVTGEHKATSPKENERYTRREFTTESFKRSFRLPETANAEGVTAEHVNGILQVRIPKAELPQPKAREISIG
jgi:HSP20 family protein